ncbi:MAG: hypothetical protein ACKD6O_08110 [Candidatus Bathyarchaeota archaeon]
MSERKPVIDRITDFLFGSFDDLPLDVRTDVKSDAMFKALQFYRTLGVLKVETADKIADIIEKLLISVNRKGRSEGVQSLTKAEFPEVQRLMYGIEEEIEARSETGEGE